MMISRTFALALAFSMGAIPAFADCNGHKKVPSDQTTQIERPAPAPSTNS
ncbi:hypothetical protein ACFSS8_10160 [Paracoccus kondratievae]